MRHNNVLYSFLTNDHFYLRSSSPMNEAVSNFNLPESCKTTLRQILSRCFGYNASVSYISAISFLSISHSTALSVFTLPASGGPMSSVMLSMIASRPRAEGKRLISTISMRTVNIREPTTLMDSP